MKGAWVRSEKEKNGGAIRSPSTDSHPTNDDGVNFPINYLISPRHDKRETFVGIYRQVGAQPPFGIHFIGETFVFVFAPLTIELEQQIGFGIIDIKRIHKFRFP